MPSAAHPAITDAFEPLVQHLAYALEVAPQLDRVARARELLREAGPELRAALTGAGALDAEVQLLDLHGMRAAEARAALHTCTEPICVVWFGKGKGVLREVFLEHFEREGGFLLVDLAGETRERPQEAMGLVLREDLHAALHAALTGGLDGPRPSGAPRAPTLRVPRAPQAPPPAPRRPPARRADRRSAGRKGEVRELLELLFDWLKAIFRHFS